MATILQLINRVRVKLGNPPADNPTNEAVLDAILGAITYYQNELKLNNQGWLVKDGFLVVDPSNNEYLLSMADFGRPLKVEYYNEQDPASPGPEIKMILLQDDDLVRKESHYHWLPWSRSITEESNDGAYIASAIAFYNLGVIPKVRIVPRPLAPATYRIHYEPSAGEPPTLLQDPELRKDYHEMLALYGTDQVLPLCSHLPDNRLMMLSTSISKALEKHESTFERFRRQAKHPDTRMRRAYVPGRR
ncbi:MAG: hypothetical protein AB1489_12035 [Acidobacteriota bacterium]